MIKCNKKKEIQGLRAYIFIYKMTQNSTVICDTSKHTHKQISIKLAKIVIKCTNDRIMVLPGKFRVLYVRWYVYVYLEAHVGLQYRGLVIY